MGAIFGFVVYFHSNPMVSLNRRCTKMANFKVEIACLQAGRKVLVSMAVVSVVNDSCMGVNFYMSH